MSEPSAHDSPSTAPATAPATGAEDLRGKYTAEEITESLTGFDELAIEKATGHTLEQMVEQGRQIQMLRALAAVVVARSDGIRIEKAYHEHTFGMRQSDVTLLFAASPDDVMPEDPDSESGKDGLPHASVRMISPPSASLPE